MAWTGTVRTVAYFMLFSKRTKLTKLDFIINHIMFILINYTVTKCRENTPYFCINNIIVFN